MVRAGLVVALLVGPACERAGATRSPDCAAQASRRSDGDVRFDWVDRAAAESFQMPGGDVRIDVTGRREGPYLVVTGVLRNQAAAPREVVYLTGGEPGSTNPFNVTVEAPERPKPPEPSRPRQEVYPEPERATLAPGAALIYERRVCAADYDLSAPKARITWGFEAWRGPRPYGFFPVPPVRPGRAGG